MAEAKTLFVTATDTDVGKTFVACAIARNLKARGVDVGVMKPVATGCTRDGGSLRCGDAEELIAASGSDDPMEMIVPVAFEPPLAPTAAARVTGAGPHRSSCAPTAGAAFDRARIFRAFAALGSRHEVLLIEGIGGLLVPLERGYSVKDMARKMNAPLVIVARDALGTINHTALTCESARDGGLEVRGIVLNRPPSVEPDRSVETNAEEIEAVTGVKVVARLGPCGGWEEAAKLLDEREVDRLVGLA